MAPSHSTRQRLFDPALEYVTGSGLVPTAIDDLREEQRLRQLNAAFSRALAVVPGGSEVAATIEGLLSGSRAAVPELARASTPGQLKAVAHEIASRVPMGLEMLQSRSKERELRARNAARRRALRADAVQQIEEGPDTRPSTGSRSALRRGSSRGSSTDLAQKVRQQVANRGINVPGAPPASHELSREELDRLNDPALRLALSDERAERTRRLEEDRRADPALALAERTEREARERRIVRDRLGDPALALAERTEREAFEQRLERDRVGDPALALADRMEREEQARKNAERARWDVSLNPPEDDPAPLVDEWLIDLMKIEVDPNRTLSEAQRDRIGRSSSEDQTLAWYIAVFEESGRENDARAVRRGAPPPDGMPGLVPDVVEDAVGAIGSALWREQEQQAKDDLELAQYYVELGERGIDVLSDAWDQSVDEGTDIAIQFRSELEELRHLSPQEAIERIDQALLGGFTPDSQGTPLFDPVRALQGLAGNATYHGSDHYLLQRLPEEYREPIGEFVEIVLQTSLIGAGVAATVAGIAVAAYTSPAWAPYAAAFAVGIGVGALIEDLERDDPATLRLLHAVLDDVQEFIEGSGLDDAVLQGIESAVHTFLSDAAVALVRP